MPSWFPSSWLDPESNSVWAIDATWLLSSPARRDDTMRQRTALFQPTELTTQTPAFGFTVDILISDLTSCWMELCKYLPLLACSIVLHRQTNLDLNPNIMSRYTFPIFSKTLLTYSTAKMIPNRVNITSGGWAEEACHLRGMALALSSHPPFC